MSTKVSELKKLLRRVRTLHDYLGTVVGALTAAAGEELHLAVLMSTRILNVIVGAFDIGTVDVVAKDDVNSRVLRLRRDDTDQMSELREKLSQMYMSGMAHLTGQMNGLAKLIEVA